jgi:VCBS repeat-containing protein/parallel beta-helix repeat protein
MEGVLLWSTTGNTVKSNYIGTNALGSTTIGNGNFGVWISDASDNTVGGVNPADGNVIARNGLEGVEVDGTSSGNAILGNSIYSNGGIGIDLVGGSENSYFVTANDSLDIDGGPNSQQNYPVLTGVYVGGGQVEVKGTLNSTKSTTFRIEVFASAAADPSTYGEGERYLGSFNITTDALGNFNFNNVLAATVGVGESVSATATNLSTNNTSEFAKTAAAVNNTAPTATNPTATGLEDAAYIPITIAGTDVEGPIASFRLASLPANGALYSDAALTTPAVTGTDYAATGNALTLYFRPLANWNGSTGFQFTAADLLGALSAPSGATINVTPVNDAPAVTTSVGSVFYIENDPATAVDPSVAVSDVDSPNLTSATVRIIGGYVNGEDVLNFSPSGGITGAWDAPSGTLALNGSATLLSWQTVLQSVAYQNTSENPTAGPRTIELVVNDGTTDSAPATRTVDVTAVNDAPTSTDDTVTTSEDTALVLSGADFGTYSDLEGSPIAAVRISSLATNGQLQYDTSGAGAWTAVTLNQIVSAADIAASRLRFVPNANDNGTPYAVIGFEVSDGTDFSAATYSLTVNVAAVNDPPVSVDDSAYAVDEDSSLSVGAASGVLTNDSDVDGNALTAVLGTGPANGTLTLNADGSFTYTPNANFNGSDSFTYRANDGAVDSGLATVTITVNPVNDAPVASDDAYSTNEDTALTIAAAGVLSNDSDVDGNALTAVLGTGPANGTLTLNADGSFTYTPRADFYGTDAFTYQAFDGSASSNIATVTITVNPVADHIMVVDTATDIVDGDVTSIDTLLRDKGADGFVSLREAILAANATANAGGPDRINFDIVGPQTINVGATGLGALPTITDAVIIDGTTDPDFAVAPVIVLDGASAGAGANGLQIDLSGGSIIKGLVIDNFRGSGLRIGGSGGNLIQGNYIGIDATGAVAAGNSGYGILLASGNNVVGGTSVPERNVISGSGIDGVYVAGSSGNIVQGNYIGTNAAGTAALGNTEDDVWLNDASNNTIGGTVAGAGNVISGNGWSGVAFTGGGAGNVVQGNLIGVDSSGTAALANLRQGVQLAGSNSATIGGVTAGTGNVIANNG